MEKMLSVLMAALLLISFLLSSCAPAAPEAQVPAEDMSFEYSTFHFNTCVGSVLYTAIRNENGHFLMYCDLETGERGYLCGKPDCEHRDEFCNAHFPAIDCVTAYEGKIYVLSHNVFYSVNPDGTERTLYKELAVPTGDGSYEAILPGGSVRFHVLNGRVYFLNVESIVTDGVPGYRLNLLSMSLESDRELETVFRQEYAYGQPRGILCPCSDGFYLAVTSVSEGRWDAQNRRYDVTARREEVFRFRFGGQGPELVWDESREDLRFLPRAFADVEGRLYYYVSDEPKLFRLENGAMAEAISFEDAGTVFGAPPWPFGNNFFAMTRTDGEWEILIKTTENETLFRGPLPVESIKALGADTGNLGMTYQGYAGSRLFLDLNAGFGETFHMSYDLTESGLKETLLWADE